MCRLAVPVEIHRVRRAAAAAARCNSNSLAVDFFNRVNANHTAIYNEDGTIKSPREWPLVLQRMMNRITFDPKTGAILQVMWTETKHLDMILANWVGMTGERLPDEGAAPIRDITVETVMPDVDLPQHTQEFDS